MKERREILRRFPDGEDHLLAARLLDLIDRTECRNVLTFSRFLDPGEQKLSRRLLECAGFPKHILSGGYEDAERKVLLLLPDYLEEENLDGEALPFTVLHAGWGRDNKASHRDVLGSLMSLGIERDTVGDILVEKTGCDVILMKDLAPFLRENWESIGRFRIHPEEKGFEELLPPAADEVILKDTVAAPRLDALVGVGFSMGRSRAAELVRFGRVMKNGRQSLKPDAVLEEGDVITARGFGKLVLEEIGPPSKKGRLRITLRKFG